MYTSLNLTILTFHRWTYSPCFSVCQCSIRTSSILLIFAEHPLCKAKEDTLIHTFAEDPENGVTKAEARDLVQRIAYVLRHRYGIGRHGIGHDVVLSTASLSPFLPIIFYSILAAGGVYSGASTAFTVGELVRQIKHSQARLLICSKEYEALTWKAAKECGIGSDRILIIDQVSRREWSLAEPRSPQWNVLNWAGKKRLDWERITDLADLKSTTTCLLYSSGTTGHPKGCRLSHWNLVTSNICSMRVGATYIARKEAAGWSFDWRTIACLPMAHIAGIQQYSINPFFMGGTTYWMPKYSFELFIEYSRRHCTTYQFSVPPIWLEIAKSPRVTDHFESLEIACSGAAPMGLELVQQLNTKLGGTNRKVFMTQTWGTTETDGSITATPWDLHDTTGSVGQILPNLKLRIVNDQDRDVPPGQSGEILVSGPIVFQGYHNNPTATASSFAAGAFYRTGDVGYVDPQTHLVYLIDRKKELIKYKGLQVAPAELEDTLMSHPSISDAAVIGVSSNQGDTEVPRAFVVTSNQGEVSEYEVKEYVKRNLAGHKQLRGGVVFVDSIPKSASGKILRGELRKTVQDGDGGGEKAKL